MTLRISQNEFSHLKEQDKIINSAWFFEGKEEDGEEEEEAEETEEKEWNPQRLKIVP